MFAFNTPHEMYRTARVRFTVDMNSQKVLGFFRPEEGDEVVVSGSFSGWQPEGTPLRHEGGGRYSALVPIRYRPGRAVSYRFRIHSPREAVFLNRGWERIPARRLDIEADEADAGFAAFNNERRVVRFEITTEKLERTGTFSPSNGDVLQIRLTLDGRDVLSDALVPVGPHLWETAVMLPLTAERVEWALVRNMNEMLNAAAEVAAGIDGRLVRMEM